MPPSHSNRIIWVDACRILCMYCVLVQHSIFLPDGYQTPWHGIIMGMAYDFTRPILPVLVFFFFSGWLQKASSKYIEWKKPLFLYAPAILFWNVVQLLVQPTPISSWTDTVNQLGIFPFSCNANGPLWFLQELMFFTLFLPLILRIPVHFRLVIVICCLWVGNSYYSLDGWGITTYSNDIAFFLAGTTLQGINKEAIYSFLRKTAVWFVPFTVYIILGVLLPEPFTFHPTNNVKFNGLSPVIGFLSMCGFSILLTIVFPKLSRLISSCSAAIFFLYASHWPLFTLYNRIASAFDVPPPHPHLYPLTLIAFIILGTMVWKAASKTNCKWLLSIVFMQAPSKPKPEKTTEQQAS